MTSLDHPGPPGSGPHADADTARTIARLERRAARERAARIEAEVIAETQLRGAYERAREVELLATISAVVNESDGLEGALSAAAKAVRRHCGFAVAHVLVPDAEGAFVTSDIWDADGDHLGFLDLVITATVDQRFPSGIGLPGQVAASHSALWLPDLSIAGNFPRNGFIPAGSAWAFPVVSGVDVVAVVEFLDPSPKAVDERLLGLARSLAAQLAHASEWERLRRREVEDRARLEALVSKQAETLAAAQREGAAIGTARLALIAYLAHEVARCAADAQAGTAPSAEPSPLHRLDDAARRLILASEATDRRLVGQRRLARPEAMLHDVLASASLGLVNAPIVSVSSAAARAFEVNVTLVERVIEELLANAVRHTATGPDRVEVDWHEDELLVRVLDRGAGLTWPPSPAGVAGGGGLAQASRLAIALGGAVSVRARDGGGAVAEARFGARAGATAGVTGEDTRELARVLVVDDNAVNRRLAAAMLAKAGLSADVVECGAEALAAMNDTAYGLVLMDIQMPGLDGRETTRTWRSGNAVAATARDVPIVALTAHVGQDERDACARAGMDDYLSKPFGLEALASTCRRWLEPDHAGSGAWR